MGRILIRDFTAKRVLYRRDRRVRRAILKKISALSAFSAMSFCSELIRVYPHPVFRVGNFCAFSRSVLPTGFPSVFLPGTDQDGPRPFLHHLVPLVQENSGDGDEAPA